ncbi:TobH protein [Mycobacterium shimoidei]|uniref:RpiR family transcriptional regulator [Kineococcus radiotolerans = ATCC BAA-149] n=1 Tax=Mycobacterium shimoidei TaxID=29313 RepID=A0A1E3TI02_MYCSH|nr:TobH protein [Mycobacterium shimoidei]MCV7257999.1 TobH protein [Mycobacterium shimoidei]ODR14069.1 TobH protein [Mycobacterium shimoidei]ORW78875.1 TobH protein [Mycobacterium shimoidei]SRX96390.1 RpiR family transcriptional regulator [Kineococcus radiotolerans = ATCC BAA-149] [Mycobacterium shimoidei]
MNATHITIDLDDTDRLIDADRDGLLRVASMAGAQVRATAAALDEGALDPVGGDERPRTVIWVAGRGPAETAGSMLAATLGGSTAQPIVVAAGAPPWVGPLDVLVVAGDDPGDPALVDAAAAGVRRGARVVVAAPYEGPLRDVAAGRAAVLEPRIRVPDEFGLCRYLAAGVGVLGSLDPKVRMDLAVLADELDAEALRNSAGREVFTNPAKSLAERMSGRAVALAGDCAATLALARHGSSAMLRLGHQVVAATGLADALTALRAGGSAEFADSAEALFHDEQIDGPLPPRLRVLALTLAAERTVVAARVASLDDVDIVGAEDVPDITVGPAGQVGAQRAEQQLAILAVRLEMTAVYLRLVQG